MDTATALQKAETILQVFAQEFKHPEPERVDVILTVENLKPAVKRLVEERLGYLVAITGMDVPAKPATEGETAEGSVDVMYHFAEGAAIITLRVNVPYHAAVVPTVCDVLPAATLYERELIEMLGVTVEGTPVTDHLILPENWPDGVYPLRKSFTGLKTQGA
jgi:NADH:ubiquinone oxidoreductase subunit C